MRLIFIGFLLSLAVTAVADPLNGSLEVGTSVSHSYQARNVFSNPAALAFETESNEPGLLSSFSYGMNKVRSSEFSFGLSYGFLGFGFEQLALSTGTYNRYSFAAGLPITSAIFLGTRYSTGNGIHSWDLGAQYRAFSFLSFGLLMNHINQPVVDYVGGVTARPIERVELSFDVNTLSNDFGKHFGYQAKGSFEVLPGLKLSAGYHNDYKFQAGLQFSVGRADIYSTVQPSPTERRFIGGFSSSVLPGRSFLKPKTALKMVTDPSLSEEGSRGSLFIKDRPSLLDLLETLNQAENNPSVGLIILKIESFPLGLASAQELSEALMRLREKGKRIEVFLGNASPKEYLIASAAHKIHMEPSGEIRFLGPRSERFYAKGTLDKIGIEPELLAKGEYKSAPEMFTRKEASPASKEATLHELKAMEDAIVEVLSKTRKEVGDWKTLTGHGLYSAKEAVAAKLIDSVDHYSDEIEKLGQSHCLQESLLERSDRLALPPRVAVIVAEGDILERKIRVLSLTGNAQVTPERMQKLFKRAVGDPRVKAIVLRVSSPGGEILASDEIASYVESAKKKKPVIVSMGDVAASGGYMISAPADKIFAQPLTVTGSVGVFLGKFNFGGLYKKIELHKEILSRAPYAGLFSEGKPWSAEERALMVRRLNEYYDGFVSYVSEKRKISKTEAETAAKGRVWLGGDAKRLKLVDERGGYREALNEAAKRAGIAKDFETVTLTTSGGLFQVFDEDNLMMRASGPLDLPLALLSPQAVRELHWMTTLTENPFLYWSPLTNIQ